MTAGLAEVVAGSIAMGLGGYLVARGDAGHYESERRREEAEVRAVPDVEADEVRQILQGYGLTAEEGQPVVAALRQRPAAWIDFMMRFELGLERPDPTTELGYPGARRGAKISLGPREIGVAGTPRRTNTQSWGECRPPLECREYPGHYG